MNDILKNLRQIRETSKASSITEAVKELTPLKLNNAIELIEASLTKLTTSEKVVIEIQRWDEVEDNPKMDPKYQTEDGEFEEYTPVSSVLVDDSLQVTNNGSKYTISDSTGYSYSGAVKNIVAEVKKYLKERNSNIVGIMKGNKNGSGMKRVTSKDIDNGSKTLEDLSYDLIVVGKSNDNEVNKSIWKHLRIPTDKYVKIETYHYTHGGGLSLEFYFKDSKNNWVKLKNFSVGLSKTKIGFYLQESTSGSTGYGKGFNIETYDHMDTPLKVIEGVNRYMNNFMSVAYNGIRDYLKEDLELQIGNGSKDQKLVDDYYDWCNKTKSKPRKLKVTLPVGMVIPSLGANASSSPTNVPKNPKASATKPIDTTPAPKVKVKPDATVPVTQVMKELEDYVKKVAPEIDKDPNLTLTYMEETSEIGKYKLPAPGLALICTDLRKNPATLKKLPIVKKFNSSKTLKRFVDWKKDKVEDLNNRDCWVSIYVHAGIARSNNIKSLKEGLLQVGYLNDDGDIERIACSGDIVRTNEGFFIVSEVDGNELTIISEDVESKIRETEVKEILVEESDSIEVYDYLPESIELKGEVYEVISPFVDRVLLLDSNMSVYEATYDDIRDLASDELSNFLALVEAHGLSEVAISEALELGDFKVVKEKEGDGLSVSINGKEYRYVSSELSASELLKKVQGLAKHAPGKALSWLKKNSVCYLGPDKRKATTDTKKSRESK